MPMCAYYCGSSSCDYCLPEMSIYVSYLKKNSARDCGGFVINK